MIGHKSFEFRLVLDESYNGKFFNLLTEGNINVL